MSPLGINRRGKFKNGNPVTLPHDFGNPITPAHTFGNVIDWTPSPAHEGNLVNWVPSPNFFGNVIGGTPTPPSFSPAEGVYNVPQTISLLASEPGLTIYYALAGEEPTIHSTQYTGPFTVSDNVEGIVKAIAVNGDGVVSSTALGTYSFKPVTPTFAPPAGEYVDPQDVVISCATPSTDIYYTTDGSQPDHDSTLYTGPISVDTTTTLKAIAVRSGSVWTDSTVAQSVYSFDPAFPLVRQAVQAVATFNGVFSTAVLNFSTPTQAGSSIVVYIQEFLTSSLPTTIDDQGNTYATVRGPDNSAEYSPSFLTTRYVLAAAGATAGVSTITLSWLAGIIGEVTAVEVANATTIDNSAFQEVTGADWTSSVDAVADDEMVLSFAGYLSNTGNSNPAFTAGAGFTQISQTHAATPYRDFAQDKLSTAGSNAVTATCTQAAGGMESITLA